MTPRQPDGSLTTPHTAQAHQIALQHPGWSVWWAPRCARYLATHAGVPALVIAATPQELTDLINQWTQWSAAMALATPK